MAMEAEIGVAPFELGGGGGRQARDSGGLKSWKKQGNRFPSEPGAGSVGLFYIVRGSVCAVLSLRVRDGLRQQPQGLI